MLRYCVEIIAATSFIFWQTLWSSFGPKRIGNNTDTNIVFPSSKFLVDLLPNVLEEDDEIFEAALGLGDFDEEWEKQASRVLGLKLISTKNVGINASGGPDLVRRPMLQRWNFERQSFEGVP